MNNGVAHFEIYADDTDSLGKFYTALFDWQLQPMQGMDYTWVKTVDTDDRGTPTQPGGINGGLLTRPAGYKGTAWVNYVNVDSLDVSVTKAKQLGARVTKDKSAVPGMGWFAMLIDPQGNEFAMWQTDAKAR